MRHLRHCRARVAREPPRGAAQRHENDAVGDAVRVQGKERLGRELRAENDVHHGCVVVIAADIVHGSQRRHGNVPETRGRKVDESEGASRHLGVASES